MLTFTWLNCGIQEQEILKGAYIHIVTGRAESRDFNPKTKRSIQNYEIDAKSYLVELTILDCIMLKTKNKLQKICRRIIEKRFQ